LTVKAYPDRVCVYFDGELIARHALSYARHQDIENAEHAKGLIARRSRAREQRLMLRFLLSGGVDSWQPFRRADKPSPEPSNLFQLCQVHDRHRAIRDIHHAGAAQSAQRAADVNECESRQVRNVPLQ
jgi:hypothetical protein